MSKDWTGNSNATLSTMGARNFARNDREQNDYYATEPKATELLMQLETFENVWEPACGGGTCRPSLKIMEY